MAFKLKKRCPRCLHVLREDGTCQNSKCVLYVEENGEAEKADEQKETDEDKT